MLAAPIVLALAAAEAVPNLAMIETVDSSKV